MSDLAPHDIETRCRAAHAWYCDLMKMRFDYRFVERHWFAALTAHDPRAIARAARYVKRQIEESGWDRNAAVPTNFLAADSLANYVSVSTPPREFRLTDDESAHVAHFRDLIGETVSKVAAAVPVPPPKNWRPILLENYPNAVDYTDFFALPDHIREEVRKIADERAQPALPNS